MFCRFGGYTEPNNFLNDTWSFNVSARKWTKLQCTGSIPSPRSGNAAVLIGDVMYVFGGLAPDRTRLGDLAALNLSSERFGGSTRLALMGSFIYDIQLSDGLHLRT